MVVCYVPEPQQWQAMRDASRISVVHSSLVRYAAVQHILGVTTLGSLVEGENRSAPALVHPASEEAEAWVVKAPATGVQTGDEPKMFTGARSLVKALEHAHSTYGSVIYFSR